LLTYHELTKQSGVEILRPKHEIPTLFVAPLYSCHGQTTSSAFTLHASLPLRLFHGKCEALMLQIATSNEGRGGRRKLPLVFTEAGAPQAASVLNSPRAIQVGIYVHRAFIQLSDLLSTRKTIAQIINTIHRLLEPPTEPKKRPIGSHTGEDE
jgi:hypothetical protein